MQHSTLQISRSNLLHNFSFFRSKLSISTKLLVLVKANGYGHGDTEISRLVEEFGADYLGVAFPIEGEKLRKAGIKLPIIILTPGIDNFDEIISHDLEPSIISPESAISFANAVKKAGKSSWPAHIKIDSGMSRVGFVREEIQWLTDFLSANSQIEVKSVFSHLSSAEHEMHDQFTLDQINLFSEAYDQISSVTGTKPIKHILNSSGIERFSQYQFDMVRLGIGIYGSTYVEGNDLLKPVASLVSPIVHIKKIKGASVGYGRHGQVGSEEREIATVPIGYADGVNRHLGRGNFSFMVNGKPAPTIGNICMDMFMLDVTGCNAKTGDTVTIFGENPTALEIAQKLGTITYEVFTSVPARIIREITE